MIAREVICAPVECPTATVASAPDARGSTKALIVHIATSKGLFEIYRDARSGEIQFNGTVLFHGEAENEIAPWRSLSRYLGAFGPFQEAFLVRWDGQGNLCEVHGFTLIGVKRDGSVTQTDLHVCSRSEDDAPTRITSSFNEVTVHLQAQIHRGGTSPPEEWVYRAGAFKRTK